MFNKKCNHRTCRECGHLFEFGGKIVVVESGRSILDFNYCRQHQKPYDRAIVLGRNARFFKIDVEVTEDGTPIGYEKIKEKNK